MAGDRLKVLYILGTGRSGSTLLSRVLGQLDGFVAPGELGLIWERGVIHNELCDCGTPVRSCAYWKSALHRSLPALDVSEARRINRLHWKMTGLASAPGLLLPNPRGPFSAEQEEYLQHLLPIYEEIIAHSGSRVLVDASKRPLHALLLASLPSVDISFIHLVRDSRAVVHSWLRLRRKDRYTVPGRSLHWLVTNLLCESLTHRFGNSLFIRYEDFCRDPQSQLSAIVSLVGECDASLHGVLSGGRVHLDSTHGLEGDQSRFQQGDLRISANEEWRFAMDARRKMLVAAATWPLLARYGYIGSAGHTSIGS